MGKYQLNGKALHKEAGNQFFRSTPITKMFAPSLVSSSFFPEREAETAAVTVYNGLSCFWQGKNMTD